jgi:hypothetical protein
MAPQRTSAAKRLTARRLRGHSGISSERSDPVDSAACSIPVDIGPLKPEAHRAAFRPALQLRRHSLRPGVAAVPDLPRRRHAAAVGTSRSRAVARHSERASDGLPSGARRHRESCATVHRRRRRVTVAMRVIAAAVALVAVSPENSIAGSEPCIATFSTAFEGGHSVLSYQQTVWFS